MDKPKGKYLDPVKAAIYRELEKATLEMTDALQIGDYDKAKGLAKIVRDLNGQLNTGGRGSSNLLKKTAAEVMAMAPARGEALVIVKTCAGTECRKLKIKETILYKRINVSIENIWAYPKLVEAEKAEEKPAAPVVEPAKVTAKVKK